LLIHRSKPVSNEKLCAPRRAGRADASESRESEASKQPDIDTALPGAPATVQLFVSDVADAEISVGLQVAPRVPTTGEQSAFMHRSMRGHACLRRGALKSIQWQFSAKEGMTLHRETRKTWSIVRTDIDILSLRPADRSKGNGILFFNIDNRGNKGGVQLSTLNLAEINSLAHPGDVFLQRQGYTMIWFGWQRRSIA
jgi:hypothetical protein